MGRVSSAAWRWPLASIPLVASAVSLVLLSAALVPGPVSAGASTPDLAPHTTPPTVAPTGVAAAPWTTRIGWVTVSYTPIADTPPDNGGLPVRSYRVTCSAPGYPTESDQDGMAPFLPVRVEHLTPGVTYTCTVAAANGRGAGPSASVLVSMPSPPTVAPTNVVTVRTTRGGAVATYDPIADQAPDDGGLPIVAYVATCTGGRKPRTAADRDPPFLAITLKDLALRTAWQCVVRAVNSLGAGPASSPTILPTPPLQAPANVVAVASADPRSVAVSFDPIGNATSYQARCSAAGKPTRRSGIVSTGPIAIRWLSSGVSYTCQVVAFNALGEGPWSEPSQPVIPL